MHSRSRSVKVVMVTVIFIATVTTTVILLGRTQTNAQSPLTGANPKARPSAAMPAAPQPGDRTLNLVFSGDLLIHSPVFQKALANGGGRRYSFAPMFRHISPIIRRADLAVCHVEVPMSPRRPAGYPLFNSPPALARAIRSAGWDSCDTASNHTLDQGQYGVDQTIRALERAGLRHTGSYRSLEDARKPLIITVSGVRIALLAYTEMTNGIPLPRRWSVGIAKADRIIADAAKARRAGASAVIVNIHAGNEYEHSPSSFQLKLARRLTASRDVTAVVGQHVHVVQPVRWINGKPVVFGEGNLLSNQTPSCCPVGSQDGLIANLRLRVRGSTTRVDQVTYWPTWVRHPDFAILPVSTALRRGLAARGALRASWSRTTSVIGRSRLVIPR